jgi:hypothetical protein
VQRDASEAWSVEIPIETEDPCQPVIVHQNEGHTIRKADLLICILPEKSESGELNAAGRSENFKPRRRVKESCDLFCELISTPARYEGDRLFYHEATREAADIILLDSLPDRESCAMMLISFQVACNEGSSINEDQSASP